MGIDVGAAYFFLTPTLAALDYNRLERMLRDVDSNHFERTDTYPQGNGTRSGGEFPKFS